MSGPSPHEPTYEPSQQQPGGPPPGTPPPGWQPGAPAGQQPGQFAPPTPAASGTPASPQPAGQDQPFYIDGFGGNPAPAAAPKRGRSPWAVVGIVLGVIVVGIGGCSAALFFLNDGVREFTSELAIDFSSGVPAEQPATCEVDGLDFADDYRVFVTVSNLSGERSHYEVVYVLTGPGGGVLGNDFGIVSNLDAGATVRDDAFGVIGNDDIAWQQVTCTVTSTTRVTADG